jgi:hypothetical protein
MILFASSCYADDEKLYPLKAKTDVVPVSLPIGYGLMHYKRGWVVAGLYQMRGYGLVDPDVHMQVRFATPYCDTAEIALSTFDTNHYDDMGHDNNKP